MTDAQGLALIIGVFMGVATIDQAVDLYRALASQSWSEVTGTVIASTLAPVSLTDRFHTDVQPLVRYRYSVDGVQYEGQTLSFGEGWWRLFGRGRFSIQREFPVGAKVPVYYNPKRPSQSALMSPGKTQEVEWRFGGRAEDVEAWLRHPAELHINVLFRPPDSTQWHSIMTVTWAWLRKQAEECHLGGIWPALLIVPDGSRPESEMSIAKLLANGGWLVVTHNEEGLPGDFRPEDL
jgi:hypothetical protein